MEHALGVGHGTPHLSRSCVGYGLLNFISDSSSNDWTATEVLPPSADETPVVGADEDILQMLVAGARVMHNEADSLGDQDDGIELNQWGNPKNRLGNQSTSTPSSEKSTVIYNGSLGITFRGMCTKREPPTVALYGDGNN